MDENDLNVHVQLYVDYGAMNELAMSLWPWEFLKNLFRSPFTISTNYTSGFLDYFPKP